MRLGKEAACFAAAAFIALPTYVHGYRAVKSSLQDSFQVQAANYSPETMGEFRHFLGYAGATGAVAGLVSLGCLLRREDKE